MPERERIDPDRWNFKLTHQEMQPYPPIEGIVYVDMTVNSDWSPKDDDTGLGAASP